MISINYKIKVAAIFALALSIFVVADASAATTYFDTNTVDNIEIEWEFDLLKDGSARIINMTNVVEDAVIENVVVPTTVRDSNGVEHTVTTIGKYAFMTKGYFDVNNPVTPNTTLKRVELPDTVTKIEDGGQGGDISGNINWKSRNRGDPGAFKSCTSLGEVVMRGVTDIGYNAFDNCSSLTNIVITDTAITNIGTQAFRNSKIVGDFDFSNLMISKLPKGTFQNTKITSIKIPTITNIGYNTPAPGTPDNGGGTFSGCNALTNIVFSPNLTAFNGSSIFAGCSALQHEEFVFEKLKGKICDRVFASIPIKRFALPLVTSIAQWVFENSTNLERVERLCSLEYISMRGQFTNNPKLKVFKFPHCLKDVSEHTSLFTSNMEQVFVHVCSPLTVGMTNGTIKTGANKSAFIPYGGAWTNEVNGQQVEWRYDDRDTPDYSLNNKATIVCATTNLTGEVEVPKTLTVSALDESGNSVTKNLSVTAIEVGAFRNNKNLTTIRIPKKVTRIGNEAFAGCTNLGTMFVYKGTTLDCDALKAEYPGVEIKEVVGSGFMVIVK